jgi:hypothetical protein
VELSPLECDRLQDAELLLLGQLQGVVRVGLDGALLDEGVGAHFIRNDCRDLLPDWW